MIPAVVAQATFATLLSLLAACCGLTLLTICIAPKLIGDAGKDIQVFSVQNVVRGLVVVASVFIPLFLWRTGFHNLRVIAALYALVVVTLVCIGSAAIVTALSIRLAGTRLLMNGKLAKTPLPPLLALVLLFAAVALPVIGWFIAAPILFLLSAGAGLKAIVDRIVERRTQSNVGRQFDIGTRIGYLIIGFALISCIAPVAHHTRVVRYTTMLKMVDGTLLATDVYLPPLPRPYPVVVIRTPDNKDAKRIMDLVDLGYAVVVQDTRGRHISHGDNLPYQGDSDDPPNDGANTIEWLCTQDWCNGKIGTIGSDTEGVIEIATAGSGTPYLSSQRIESAAPSLYNYTVYPGGIYHKNAVEYWIRDERYGANALGIWRNHPLYDDYWLSYDFVDRWARVKWPMLHIGGWYDPALQGTLDLFNGLQTDGGPGARGKQHVIIGPWSYGNHYSSRTGDLRFPNAETPNVDYTDTNMWLNYTLMGVHNGLEKMPAVNYYLMGDTSVSNAPGNVWKSADTWPPENSTVTPFYMHSDKSFNQSRPAKDQPLTYVFNPASPVPTVGGREPYLPSGPVDQKPLLGRQDVLTFTGELLQEPLEITGRVKAHIYISSDSADTDFFVKLCDVYPDGRSLNICEGQLRARFRFGFLEEVMLTPGTIYPLDIDLWSTSIVINKGHKLQVLVTSSNSPAFEVNTNTGRPAPENNGRTQIAHKSVYLDAEHPSAILLPVVH